MHLVPNVPKILGYREVYPDDSSAREKCRRGQKALGEKCQLNIKIPSATGAEGWVGLETSRKSIKGKGRI